MTTHTWQTGAPASDWDSAQAILGAHFLQSSAWARFQVSLGKLVFYTSGNGWSWLAILERNRFGTRLYCPYGPTVQAAEKLEPALATLAACSREHHAMLARVEPQGPLTPANFQHSALLKAPRDIQPHYTWVKALTADEDALIADMTATNRNLHRTATNKGLSFRRSTALTDLPIFLDMMHEVAERNDITIHSDEYFTTMAETLLPADAGALYFAKHDGKPVASAFIFDSRTTRYYAHAGARFEARKLHPGSPLVSRMILDAKKAGLSSFDFCGIAPPDQPNHRWIGITKFKQSFGGRAVDMHGTWELPIRRAPYSLYKALRRFGG